MLFAPSRVCDGSTSRVPERLQQVFISNQNTSTKMTLQDELPHAQDVGNRPPTVAIIGSGPPAGL